ncbi:hypothetical protein M885DRAFT_504465 [Pelagophyceae sp. CCMP2097]|nr:hypothetical protein M885DRAFT_504465 [Pelagophyceae sp. CCMP2097]|mmetsp:Transcript_5526/g.19606  ORF Transcript_5526/g.19606 Transcript_5526/m.19606 type:complete len:450 (+) Transcript_5526:120-1469(+)
MVAWLLLSLAAPVAALTQRPPASAALRPQSSSALRGLRAWRGGPRFLGNIDVEGWAAQSIDFDVDDFDYDAAFEAARAARIAARTGPPGGDLAALAIPFAIVALLLIAATVITVPTDDATPPPNTPMPRLIDYCGREEDDAKRGGKRGARPRETALALQPLDSLGTYAAATLFQWKVFALETGSFPTGFSRSSDNAAIELLRAAAGFPKALQNAKTYEALGAAEFQAGADAAAFDVGSIPRLLFDARASGEANVRRAAPFVQGVGLSLVAKSEDDGEWLGLVSLRLRRLPPRGAMVPLMAMADDGQVMDAAAAVGSAADGDAAAVVGGPAECFRNVAYITGLAVSRNARRKGVASALVNFCDRKSAAWGADGLALHVNKLNAPALRFYAARGFDVVPDWLGHNTARFLLYKPRPGEEAEFAQNARADLEDEEVPVQEAPIEAETAAAAS